MKRIAVAVALMMLLSAVALQAQTPAPKPGPEHQKLGAMVGTWTYESESKLTGTKNKGSMTCNWENGGFFVACRIRAGSGESMWVSGYSPQENVYTMYSYVLNTGASSLGKGWLRGDTWTFVYEGEQIDGKLRRRQSTSKMTPTTWTYKWERSMEGEPWIVTSEGKFTRVK